MNSNWTEVRLQDVCSKIGSGATPKGGKDSYKNEGISLVRSQNVLDFFFSNNGLAFIDKQQAQRLKNVIIENDDVLLNITGDSVARVCSMPKGKIPARVNQHVAIVRANKKKLDPSFLKYFLLAPKTKSLLLNLSSAGATRKALTKSMINNLSIPVPPLPEQKKIAHILGTLDDKIEINRQTNATLEAMAQALFQSWFVDFDPVIDNAIKAGNPMPEPLQTKAKNRKAVLASGQYPKLPEHIRQQFPSSFVYSETLEKWIPEGWEVKTLNEVISLIGGGTPKTSVDDYWNGEICWFSVVDAPNNSDVFVNDTEKKITELGLNNSSTKLLREGTTIISARGTVGKCAIVGKEMAMNQSCYGINGLKGFTDYFVYFLVRKNVSDLQRKGHGSVFNTITRSTFDSIPIAVPNEKSIQKFEDKVKSSLEKIKHNLFNNSELKITRNILLPQLISGKLSVADIDIKNLANV